MLFFIETLYSAIYNIVYLSKSRLHINFQVLLIYYVVFIDVLLYSNI